MVRVSIVCSDVDVSGVRSYFKYLRNVLVSPSLSRSVLVFPCSSVTAVVCVRVCPEEP